ncbi:hypothetical protein OEZ86_008682 [Tetradesmus obliquus]|nr:hypothetical protein OEZ86_008682 [Tetradesmus obliquus]
MRAQPCGSGILQLQRRRVAPCYAASNTTSSNSFTQKAQEFAETAQQRVQEFVQEQKLDEKAAAASKQAKEKFSAAYEETEQNVRRTYMKLESEHNISDRVGRTKKWVNETVRDFDQEYSVSRRFKSLYDDAKRMAPTWKRQFNSFSSTQLGKATLTLAFVGLLFSGLLWQLLNVFWLLWWVSVPVSLLLASQGRKAAQQQGAGVDPSSQFGQQRWGDFGNSSSSSKGGSEGPVVEAEWTTIDEEDSSSSSSSSSSGKRWR